MTDNDDEMLYDSGEDEATEFDQDGNAIDGSMENEFEDFSTTEEDDLSTTLPDVVEDEPIVKEYAVDFKTGKLLGGKVSGVDAIKVWAWNVLQINRFEFEQFTWNCGSELETLIGKAQPASMTKSDAQRMVEECLTQNKYITGIDNFEADISDDALHLSFTILTTLGEVGLNVTV